MQSDLPSRQQYQGHDKETPGVSIRYKHKWSEHHGIVPVVDPADAAAPVLENPGLEWTEKQYADHIAYTVSETDQYENIPVDSSGKI